MSEDQAVTEVDFDATHLSDEAREVCESEDLAHIGATQSFGFVLVGDTRTGLLVQLSENAPQALQLSKDRADPESMLGEHMMTWMGEAWEKATLMTMHSEEIHAIPLETNARIDGEFWECIGHRSGEYCILEFLPRTEVAGRLTLGHLEASLVNIRATSDLQELAEDATHVFQEYSGFDRVMFYRFMPDWSGEVIAEATGDGVERQYVGLRFPPGDIPPQARALYSRSRVRFVADSDANGVPMLPARPRGSREDLDLSACLLRAVSVAHLSYMRSMGVRSSLSVAIHQGGKLWGLIACHHLSQKPLNTALLDSVLGAARLIAEVIESQLEARIERDERQHRERVVQSLTEYLLAAQSVDYEDHSLRAVLRGIHEDLGYACVGIIADSGSYYLNQDGIHADDHPALATVADIFDMSYSRDAQATVEIRSLAESSYVMGSEAEGLEDVCGLLIYRPSLRGDMLFFLGLPEEVEEINWAGDPNAVRTTKVDDKLIVRPRDSFDRWKSQQNNHCRFWLESDRQTVVALADAVNTWVAERDRLVLERQMLDTRYIDSLTGLPNRNWAVDLFANKLSTSIAPRRRAVGHGLVLIIDVVDFKSVNARRGYPAGDACLKAMAERLEPLLPTDARLFRLGDDDFALLSERMGEDLESVERRRTQLETRIVGAFDDPIRIDGSTEQLQVLTGGAVFDSATATFSSIMRQADLALRRAKNQIMLEGHLAFHEHSREQDRLTGQGELADWIADKRFRSVFSPRIDGARSLVAMHLDAQLHHPDGRIIGARSVINRLRGEDLASVLATSVFLEAAEVYGKWHEDRDGQLPMLSLTLIEEHALDPRLVGMLLEQLKDTHVPAEKILFLVPEVVCHANADGTRSALREFKAAGFSAGIGGFRGDGRLLSEFPTDSLSAIRLHEHWRSVTYEQDFLRWAAGGCASIGLPLIVPGVDSADELGDLAQLGGLQLEGAAVGLPLEPAAFAASWLTRS